MARILISGYYGFRNIGDEAVLGGLLAGLRAELPEAVPVVLSGDPQSTRNLHGVEAIPRMDITAIRAELRAADLFISGGGSLLQDVTSLRSPAYYLGMLALAQWAKVPTLMLAQGVGPLNHPLNRRLARFILNRLRAVTVRDAASGELLRQLGVTKPPIEVTADPSFLLEPMLSPRLAAWWEAHIPTGRPVIGVAVRPWRGDRHPALAAALAALAAHSGALILFLPMQHEVDLPVSVDMASALPESRVLDIPLTPREMIAAAGHCDFLVAMRLHALIFAVQQRVPALGLAYDPKVRDFALAAGLPAPPRWEDITAESLTPLLTAQWDTRHALRESLRESAPRLTALARRNIAVVREALGNSARD